MADESRPRLGGPGAATSGTTGQAVGLSERVPRPADSSRRAAPVRGCIELDLAAELDPYDGELVFDPAFWPDVHDMAVRVNLGHARRVSHQAAARIASATWGATYTDVVGRHRQAVEDVLAVVRAHRERAEEAS